MPTHEHKQTLTDITMPNKATHPLAHWLCGFSNGSFCFLVWSVCVSLHCFRGFWCLTVGKDGARIQVPPLQEPTRAGSEGVKGSVLCKRNAQRGTISNTRYPWAQHQFLLITVLSAVALFKQLAQMLMSSYLHIYFFLCWNVIDYYVLRWWMPLLMHSDM